MTRFIRNLGSLYVPPDPVILPPPPEPPPPEPPPVGDAMAEPRFEDGLPGTVLHFEDPLQYTTTPSLEEANSARYGGPWSLRGGFVSNGGSYQAEIAEPYFGGGAIEFRHGPGGIQDGGVVIPRNSLVNGDPAIDVLVAEFAFQHIASRVNVGNWGRHFQSKMFDMHGQSRAAPIPACERIDWLTDNQTFQLGGEDARTCAEDPVCSIYYADSGGLERRPEYGDWIPPRSSHTPPYGPPHRFCIKRQQQLLFQSAEFQAMYPGITRDDFNFVQNLHWGLGPRRFDLNSNYDGNGRSAVESGIFLYHKFRFTLNRGDRDVDGDGRMEVWVGQEPGRLLKIMQYVGDQDARDDLFPGRHPGTIWMGSRLRNFFEAQIGFCWPQRSGIIPSGDFMGCRLAGVRVWSHHRLPVV